MKILDQKGVVPVFVLLAALGLVGFVVISSSAGFKDKLFAQLFPKPISRAVSGPISGPIDSIPPTVSITNPLNGAAIRKNSTVNITANASDNVAVTKVEFSIAGTLLCLDTSAPYSCSWNVPKQPKAMYSITAKAFDAAGNSAQQTVNVAAR